jgi:hypothetical protein
MATPPYEQVIDLFTQLMPEALTNARTFVLARTPPEYQPLMQRLVNSSMVTPLSNSLEISHFSQAMSPPDDGFQEMPGEFEGR